LNEGIAGYQVDREGRKEELRIRGGSEATNIPLVVLVNQGSASGSELLAGALQDRQRAVLIGTRTFGKGSVNHLRELSDGSALYVTIGRWLTPSGRQIEGNGLQPDVAITFTEDDLTNRRDAQLSYAIQALQAKISGQPLPPAPPQPSPPPSPQPISPQASPVTPQRP
jgi:carboxyl-terminal processing protease